MAVQREISKSKAAWSDLRRPSQVMQQINTHVASAADSFDYTDTAGMDLLVCNNTGNVDSAMIGWNIGEKIALPWSRYHVTFRFEVQYSILMG